MTAMLRTRITSKGQVTIPIEARRQLDLQPGDELVFAVRDRELYVWGLKRRKLSGLRGSLEAARSFPGRDAIREEVGRRLGEHPAPPTHIARLKQDPALPPQKSG
jgi:AbrB family looped-hinge helix DNA binding protein